MKKIIAINGSPRKTGNTAILLQKVFEGAASKGAQTEIINLYDLNYKGCISCFSCKLKNEKHWGKCAMKDELSPVLNKVMESDAVVLGAPIYFGDITGEMRSFLERLLFMNLSYDNVKSNFKGRINSGFVFTMNANQEQVKQYELDKVFDGLKIMQLLLNGSWEYIAAYDTYQFNDYSKYAAGFWNENHKKKVREEQFPVDRQQAFEMGERLIG